MDGQTGQKFECNDNSRSVTFFFQQLIARIAEGIEIAKTQGKYTGRKPIEIDWTRFGLLYGE